MYEIIFSKVGQNTGGKNMFRKGLAKKITTVITAASFSPYVIVYEAKASTEAPSTSKDDISTGDSMMVIYAAFAMVLALAGAAAYSKKRA